jgi:hypothetical protein
LSLRWLVVWITIVGLFLIFRFVCAATAWEDWTNFVNNC